MRHSIAAVLISALFAGLAVGGPAGSDDADPRPVGADGTPVTHARDDTAGDSPLFLLGSAYPLEVSAPFHAALLHWLDSLTNSAGAGLTAGKTVAVHRATYRKQLGDPSTEDVRQLQSFSSARVAYLQGSGDDDGLTRAFFDASDLDAALDTTRELLGEAEASALDAAIRYFEPRYRRIWNEGSVTGEFLRGAASDDDRRKLAGFLVDVAGFFGVDPAKPPHPHLVLAPVAGGDGTHAQAIGRYLLVEVRPGEGLLDQVAPIVHENAHFLFHRIDQVRLAALRRAAVGASPRGADAWRVLAEALPTAIAQGLAEQRLRPERWSMSDRWYHTDAVDTYAKRIFPHVKNGFERGRVLDGEMVIELIEAWSAKR